MKQGKLCSLRSCIPFCKEIENLFEKVQELSLREITLEVLNYMWSRPKVTHVVSIAAGDRTKASLAELQEGEGEPDLFFSFFVFCVRL